MLAMKVRQGVFAAALDEQLPPGAIVLEGVSDWSADKFSSLIIAQRRIFGGDMCSISAAGQRFPAAVPRIANAAFLQMNLFKPPFRDESFDVVISNGVLHHTGDARGGFAALLRKLKPGAHHCRAL